MNPGNCEEEGEEEGSIIKIGTYFKYFNYSTVPSRNYGLNFKQSFQPKSLL